MAGCPCRPPTQLLRTRPQKRLEADPVRYPAGRRNLEDDDMQMPHDQSKVPTLLIGMKRQPKPTSYVGAAGAHSSILNRPTTFITP